MNKIASAGSVYLMPDLKRPVSLAMNLFLLRTNQEKTNQKFIYFYLKANESYIKQFATGTAATTITKNAVRELEILLPPLSEQKAIASILSSLDDKIELNQQMNQTLEAIARAIFKSWFVDFDPVRAKMAGNQPVGMDAATANLFPDSFEESALGLIPKGWKVGTVGDVIDIFDSKRIPLSNKERLKRQGHYLYYGAASVMDYIDDYLFDGTGLTQRHYI